MVMSVSTCSNGQCRSTDAPRTFSSSVVMSHTSSATVRLSAETTDILARTEHEGHHRTCRTLGAGPTRLIPILVESGTAFGLPEPARSCAGHTMRGRLVGRTRMSSPIPVDKGPFAQCGMVVGKHKETQCKMKRSMLSE